MATRHITATKRFITVLSLALLVGCSGTPVVETDVEIERRATMYESYVRSQMAYYVGDTARAIAYGRTARDAGPEFTYLHLHLGKLLAEAGEVEEAEQVFADGLGTSGDILEVQLEFASLLEEADDLVRAEAMLREATLTSPDKLAPYRELAALLVREDRIPESQVTLRSYLDRHPDDPAAWRSLAAAYGEGDQLQEALEAYQEALALEPNFQDDYAYAIAVAGRVGDFETSERLADACIHYFRRSIMCRVQHIRSIEAMGLDDADEKTRTDEVLRTLGRAIGANVNRLRRAERSLRRELGVQHALSFLYSVAADRPRNTQIQSMVAWAAYYNDEEELAVDYMRAVLDVRPQDPSALNFIGYSYAERGIHLEEAEQLVLAALQIRPDDANIQDSLGWVYFKVGNYEDAIYWLELAVSSMPDSAVILDHLADAYRAHGDVGLALENYRLALPLADDDLASQIQTKIDELEHNETT